MDRKKGKREREKGEKGEEREERERGERWDSEREVKELKIKNNGSLSTDIHMGSFTGTKSATLLSSVAIHRERLKFH